MGGGESAAVNDAFGAAMPFFDPCLPSLMPVFGVWDGSFTLCTLADFRPGSLFSAFGTEVLLSVPLRTSVPEAIFRHLGRKFYSLYPCGLPSRKPFFSLLDGSFTPCALADFRL